jgi:hypothetical protein
MARVMNFIFQVYILWLFLYIPALAQAAEYHCTVKKKFDSERVYTADQIEKGQFSVLVEENGKSAFLSRCSFTTSAQKVTCDRYEVDKIAFDENVKIKKYYVFHSQFDVQLFPNLFFIENNGRGGIAYGTCTLVAP